MQEVFLEMSMKQKKEILSLLATMHEVHSVIYNLFQNDKFNEINQLLLECQEGAMAIGNILEKKELKDTEVIKLLENYCEQVYQVSLQDNYKNYSTAYMLLEDIINGVEGCIENIMGNKYEIVFMPYNAAMWDSMESVWESAYADDSCECYVVVIPYVEKNCDGTVREMKYEGQRFPEYVDITPWLEYKLEDRKPDIVYIHNPYDNYNYVTSVYPDFYSSRIKQYTDMLVYIPYFISLSQYDKLCEAKERKGNVANAVYKADRIILQCDNLKYIYTELGVDEKKIEVLGSPKIDFIVKNKHKKKLIRPEWQEAAKGKTVFLLNTTINSLLTKRNIFFILEHVIELVQEHQEYLLIWRPHPLIEATLHSMRKDKEEQYYSIIEKIKKIENIIIDNSPDFYAAVELSDALISDHSSLIALYLFTGKPIHLFYDRNKPKKYITLDYYGCYFSADGVTIKEFCAMVADRKDPKKEERLLKARETIVNTDGSCGERIHQKIMSLM